MQKPILRRTNTQTELQTNKWIPGDYHSPNQSLDSKGLQNIVPVSMLKNYWQSYFNSQKPLWSPLTSKKYLYPREVQEMFREDQKVSSSQGRSELEQQNFKAMIGMNHHVYWCFKGNRLILWQYGSNQRINNNQHTNPYPIVVTQFDMPISAVWVAQVSNVEGILEGTNKLVVVAFGHSMKLFKLSIVELQPINIIIRSSSYCIRRIFIQSSCGRESWNPQSGYSFQCDSTQRQTCQLCDIVYSDCDGNVGVFDLKRLKKYDSRPLHKKFLKGLYKQQFDSRLVELVCNQTGPSNLKIHCLVIQKSRQSAVGFLKWVSTIFKQPKIMSIIKTFQRNQSGVQLKYSTKEDALYKKLQDSYQYFFENRTHVPLRICTIAKLDNRASDIKIIFQQGLSVIARDHGYLAFVGSIDVIPQSPQIKGFAVQIEPKLNNSFHSIYFGCENAIISNTSIIAQTDCNMHHIANRQEEDTILSLQSWPQKYQTKSFSKNQKWLVFNKNFMRVYTALKPSDIVLLYAQIFCELQSSQQLAYRNHSKINEKIVSLVKVWGHVQFTTYIIQLLALKNTYQLQIEAQHYQSTRSQITGKTRPFQAGVRIIKITLHSLKFLEFLLFYYNEQNNSSKEGSSIVVRTDSIWHALNIIFAEMLYPLRHKTPSFFAVNSILLLTINQQMYCLEPVLRLIIQRESKQAKIDQIRYEFSGNRQLLFQREEEAGLSERFKFFDDKDRTASNDITRDSMIDQQSLVIKNSTVKICEKMQESIPKIKMLIDIYISLAECDKNQQMPSLQAVLSYTHSRKILGQIIVGLFRYNNELMLDQINKVLPELKLQQIRAYYLWKAQFLNSKLERPIEQPTVEAMANIMNEDNYQQIQKYYTDQQYPQHLFLTRVLLKKMQTLRHQIIDLQHREKSQQRRDESECMDRSSLHLHIHQLKESLDVYSRQVLKVAIKICQLYKKNKDPCIKSTAEKVLLTIQKHSYSGLKEQLTAIKREYPSLNYEQYRNMDNRQLFKCQFIKQRVNRL